jgi:hypothetical protein
MPFLHPARSSNSAPLFSSFALALALSLSLVTGCGASEPTGKPAQAPPGRPCTMMAALHGFGLEIDPAIGPKVESAKLTICWDGACRTQALELHPSTGPMITSSPSSSSPNTPVSATAGPPTGGKFAYAPVPDLPAKPVEVQLELLARDGQTVLKPSASVTPRMVEANGPGCGESGPTGSLEVAADGTLRSRTSPSR